MDLIFIPNGCLASTRRKIVLPQYFVMGLFFFLVLFNTHFQIRCMFVCVSVALYLHDVIMNYDFTLGNPL